MSVPSPRPTRRAKLVYFTQRWIRMLEGRLHALYKHTKHTSHNHHVMRENRTAGLVGSHTYNCTEAKTGTFCDACMRVALISSSSVFKEAEQGDCYGYNYRLNRGMPYVNKSM